MGWRLLYFYEKFEDIEVLCRIYESANVELSTNTAEYTNSQNPVQSRDIRSNDFAQKKLEKELLAKGWYYERKKGQHQDKPRNLRIDAEKAGQVLMALFNEMPAEAKAHKRWIFADKYDDIFNDNLTTDKVLLCLYLFSKIEEEKNSLRVESGEDFIKYQENSFVIQASYYILFLLKRLAEQNHIIRQKRMLTNKNHRFAWQKVGLIRNEWSNSGIDEESAGVWVKAGDNDKFVFDWCRLPALANKIDLPLLNRTHR